jgi:hypothetical protein
MHAKVEGERLSAAELGSFFILRRDTDGFTPA